MKSASTKPWPSTCDGFSIHHHRTVRPREGEVCCVRTAGPGPGSGRGARGELCAASSPCLRCCPRAGRAGRGVREVCPSWRCPGSLAGEGWCDSQPVAGSAKSRCAASALLCGSSKPWAPAGVLRGGNQVLKLLKRCGQKAGSWACFSPCFSFCSFRNGALPSVFLFQPPKLWKIAIMKGNDTVWGAGFHSESFQVV